MAKWIRENKKWNRNKITRQLKINYKIAKNYIKIKIT